MIVSVSGKRNCGNAAKKGCGEMKLHPSKRTRTIGVIVAVPCGALTLPVSAVATEICSTAGVVREGTAKLGGTYAGGTSNPPVKSHPGRSVVRSVRSMRHHPGGPARRRRGINRQIDLALQAAAIEVEAKLPQHGRAAARTSNFATIGVTCAVLVRGNGLS